ncbi:MAG TPA: hypothetical protein VEQ35_03620, partial [Beijerinckia sp.]|nr:hypothetical protein [Beijerinckia sp.]
TIILAAVLAALATNVSAQTKPHRHRQHAATHYYDERPPLTVSKRSFLDPGPVVPVGSLSNYVTASTVFGRTSDQDYLRSRFGNEALPWPLEIPARPQPIAVFETPALGY